MAKWNVSFRMNVDFDNREIIYIISRCHALASVINNIPITPRRKKKLDSLNIIRAVRGTTGIEGALLTEDEVRNIIKSPNTQVLPAKRQREEQEARNADFLMRYVARLVRENPKCVLDEKLILTFHKILTKDIEYERNIPGEYRTVPVRVDNYTPPLPSELKDLVAGFLSWFNGAETQELDPIIKAIVAHFYVVSIHPFADGNGRTARGVESFLLYQAGINARGFYSLANYYYQHRPEYLSILDYVRFHTEDDLTPFILFALKGLELELKDVHKEVLLEVKEIAFRDYVRDILDSRLGTKLGNRLSEFMFILGAEDVPVKAIREGTHPLGRLYRNLNTKTLARDLAELEKNNLVILRDGKVQANFDVMEAYIAPNQILN